MQLLFEIEDVFDISGRGCVLVPGIPKDFPDSVEAGTQLLIRTPRGDEIRTSVNGLEMISRGRSMSSIPFSLPQSVNKENLPIGSKVYVVHGTVG